MSGHKHACTIVGGGVPAIGENSWLANDSILDTHAPLTIGRDVFVGHRVMILTGYHDYFKFGGQRKGACLSKPVVIEDGVWLCSGAIICPGVTVGKHAVVGPGAVVLRNVRPYTVVAGNPARFVRRLKDEE